jgi:hypothetical protein
VAARPGGDLRASRRNPNPNPRADARVVVAVRFAKMLNTFLSFFFSSLLMRPFLFSRPCSRLLLFPELAQGLATATSAGRPRIDGCTILPRVPEVGFLLSEHKFWKLADLTA